MLRAIVLGYDICARMLLALKDAQLLKSGMHAGAKGGLFGSAAAAGALISALFNIENIKDARALRRLYVS